jgi:hypothetical protein
MCFSPGCVIPLRCCLCLFHFPQGNDGPYSPAAFTQLRQHTLQLQQAVAAAAERLERQREQASEVAAAAKVSVVSACDVRLEGTFVAL